jgi:hypothetical protein
LPPNCVATNCVTASADGTYPMVPGRRCRGSGRSPHRWPPRRPPVISALARACVPRLPPLKNAVSSARSVWLNSTR